MRNPREAEPRTATRARAAAAPAALRPPAALAACGLVVAVLAGLVGSTVPLAGPGDDPSPRVDRGGDSRLYAEMPGEMTGVATMTPGVDDPADPLVTGSIAAPEIVPDEDRIDRSWKGDLPATITTPATAPGFSAGSIFDEHSRLAPPEAIPVAAFSDPRLPLSSLAVARFIRPEPPRTDVADLGPAPLPKARPDTTLLVAANFPLRARPPANANATASSMLAAYAPDGSVVGQDMFAALFAQPPARPAAPAETVRPGDHWWAKLFLPSEVYSAAEQKCLAEAVYFESRGEPYKGQVAVAQVVLNRVRNPAYPATVCDVVYQNRTVRNACQFSFACDGIKDVVRSRKAWAEARKVARDVSFRGVRVDTVGSATHYHATYVRPAWASVFTRKAKIGRHVFYQTIHGGWS